MRWARATIFVHTALPHILACSTGNYDSVYDIYPDCVSACLACEDASYSGNFANNCDYENGECCTSQYHSAIAETWSCVRTNCGKNISKDAFDTFVEFCKAMDHPLDDGDVPQGYHVDGSETDEPTDASDQLGLTKGQIIGIASGCATGVGALIGLVSLIRKCCKDRRERRNQTATINNQSLIPLAQLSSGGNLNQSMRQGDVTLLIHTNLATLRHDFVEGMNSVHVAEPGYRIQGRHY